MDNLAMYLFDLTQNSISAHAKTIACTMTEYPDQLDIIMSDDGCGMDENALKHATSPFYTTRKTRSVGLGLPLIKWLCEKTEGSFEITSEMNKGTTLNFTLKNNHVDMPPLGDLGEMIVLIAQVKEVDQYIFTYQKGSKSFIFDLKVYQELLKETLYQFDVMEYLKGYIVQEINIVREKE
ncbi:MAG: hypothetical protein A2Y45_03650 [Tenericutes bacterium GWC2_34_14]|nr:MAG: hypothetical protein A2Y45_03650 [Tenericutes bacterium GWC2_34_14]OHE34312.1 MAG: hypothetical protein A2012_09240 [Tenericutes bacterium GWE2_34_108]OHE35664.1 MAG: hypothetical protein A2Y46_06005 [Tenericutes bacterium GWF1_35_14]OHE38879.1 MAG: hypothetical protein A2Y44_00440 [Tenericutes bacterium GWF2_35_184]OHE43911.1 MAG: hypothetical protein A2221_10335 [Tenericutes bacterium RIFOXYA2_FULL_36_32]OHE46350.1 MAG: hypothetical protein A2308_02500 [Tenericutes bacterium RIFOXYB2